MRPMQPTSRLASRGALVGVVSAGISSRRKARAVPAYFSLDASKIVSTIERLARRIHERFPNASLARLADELLRVARDAVARVETLTRPNLLLRSGSGILLVGLVLLLFIVIPGASPVLAGAGRRRADPGARRAVRSVDRDRRRNTCFWSHSRAGSNAARR